MTPKEKEIAICGWVDSFVMAEVTGGSYYGVITYHNDKIHYDWSSSVMGTEDAVIEHTYNMVSQIVYNEVKSIR